MVKKNILALLWTLVTVSALCGFAPVPPTGDTRPFGLIIAIVVVSGIAVVALAVWLILRSRKAK